MTKLLHIIASPRKDESRTLRISKQFLDHFKGGPGNTVAELDLFNTKLPELSRDEVSGKFILMRGADLPEHLKACWAQIEKYIRQFLAADIYLITAPMWNFSIPYVLKHYIDVIAQPRYLFRYTAQGPEGLIKNKKMIIVTSRGGDYTAGTPAAAYDHQEPYLRTVFGFVGITDITFVNAQPMDAGGEVLREQRIKEAMSVATVLVACK
jgi:FMN-dependent NADH-azoreductase